MKCELFEYCIITIIIIINYEIKTKASYIIIAIISKETSPSVSFFFFSELFYCLVENVCPVRKVTHQC